IQPYAYRFDVTHGSAAIQACHAELEQSGERVRFAGRLMTKRGHGKAAFAHVKDREGLQQIYLREDVLGPDAFAQAMDLDLGDWVGVEGTVFVTKTGEITIRAERAELLAKSLRPLPEKWHGLTDVEIRYRQRYTDLIVNDEDMLESTQAMLVETVKAVHGGLTVPFDGTPIDFTPPWPRLTIREAAQRGLGVSELPSDERSLRGLARRAHVGLDPAFGYGRILDEIVSVKVQPGLRKPTFLVDHPRETSPLAKAKRGNPDVVER